MPPFRNLGQVPAWPGRLPTDRRVALTPPRRSLGRPPPARGDVVLYYHDLARAIQSHHIEPEPHEAGVDGPAVGEQDRCRRRGPPNIHPRNRLQKEDATSTRVPSGRLCTIRRIWRSIVKIVTTAGEVRRPLQARIRRVGSFHFARSANTCSALPIDASAAPGGIFQLHHSSLVKRQCPLVHHQRARMWLKALRRTLREVRPCFIPSVSPLEGSVPTLIVILCSHIIG